MGDRWLVGWLLVGASIIVAAGATAAVSMPASAVISGRSDGLSPVNDTRLADRFAWRSLDAMAAVAGEQIGSLGRQDLASALVLANRAALERVMAGTTAPAGRLHQAAADGQVVDGRVDGRVDDRPATIRHLWFERDGEPIVVPEPLAVGSDVEAATLRRGPGHYPSTALPGQPGNIGIAGHRTTFGAPFAAVDRLAVNDTVHLLDDHGREWVYTFVASAVVDPDEVWVLADDALGHVRDFVTLTTCHPRFSASRRLVVWAELVGAVDHR